MPINQYRLLAFRLGFHEIVFLLICGLDNYSDAFRHYLVFLKSVFKVTVQKGL